MTAHKFLKFWIILSLLILGIVITLNYIIDPYLLYGTKRIEGFNNVKPAAGNVSYQSKIYLAHRLDINALVIGNSRPEMGINPDHAYFKNNHYKLYNLGQRGSSTATQYGYALDILRDKNIKMVMIGVDFIDFITSEENLSHPDQWPPQKSTQDNRRKYKWDGTYNDNYSCQYYKDIYLPLISLSTLQDSLITIFQQNSDASDLLNNGFNPAGDMQKATRTEGVKILFNQKTPQLIRSFTSRKWKIYSSHSLWSPSFNNLQFLLNYLQKNRIETKIFINPYHIQYLEIIEHSGLGPEFTDWKRQLTKMVAAVSKKGDFTLWNFSDPHIYNTEPILNTKKIPLKWFWEPAHYRKELGDLMINRMFSPSLPRDNKNQFGYQLTPENIDRHLADYQKRLKDYQNEYPEEYDFIKAKFLARIKP